MTSIRTPLARALLAAAVIHPVTAAAQQWDLGVTAARTMGAPLGVPLTTVAPNGAIAGTRWRITSTLGTLDRSGAAQPGMIFSAATLGPRLGRFRTEAFGDFSTRVGDVPEDLRAAARVHFAWASHGAWAGLGLARAGGRTGALRTLGGWLQGRLGSASLRFDQVSAAGQAPGPTSFDTIGGSIAYVYRPGSPPLRIHSLSARLATPGGRLELELGAARSEGSLSRYRHSTSAVATWWVDRTFALIGGYGPPVGDGFLPAPGATKLGVLWRPFKGVRHTLSLAEPAALAVTGVVRAGPGRWLIRIPADGARSVELQGSFGEWEPVAMQPRGDGWWEVTLPLSPGRYELAWRRDDGDWRTLPGLPAVNDDLLGRVSVLVIDRE